MWTLRWYFCWNVGGEFNIFGRHSLSTEHKIYKTLRNDNVVIIKNFTTSTWMIRLHLSCVLKHNKSVRMYQNLHLIQSNCQSGFAQGQMMRLLIVWRVRSSDGGLHPPLRRLESACGKTWNPTLLLSLTQVSAAVAQSPPQLHQLFEFSMRISDFDRMQDARFDFKPTVQPRRTWTEGSGAGFLKNQDSFQSPSGHFSSVQNHSLISASCRVYLRGVVWFQRCWDAGCYSD